MNPLPVREVVEVAVDAGHHEAGRHEFTLAGTADRLVPRWVELRVVLQFAAVRAGVQLRETSSPYTVAGLLRVDRRRKLELLDTRHSAEARLPEGPGATHVPGVEPGDDEGLVVDRDHGADAVGGDGLGPADLPELAQRRDRCAGPDRSSLTRGRRSHRFSRKKVEEASTSRRLHSVGQPARPSGRSLSKVLSRAVLLLLAWAS